MDAISLNKSDAAASDSEVPPVELWIVFSHFTVDFAATYVARGASAPPRVMVELSGWSQDAEKFLNCAYFSPLNDG